MVRAASSRATPYPEVSVPDMLSSSLQVDRRWPDTRHDAFG